MVTRAKRRRDWQTAIGYMFLLPGFLFFSFAVLIPLIMGFDISFTNWNGIAPEYTYVGFENFRTMLRDPRIIKPIENSLRFALIGVVGSNVISLSLALLVNNNLLTRSHLGILGKTARMVYFIPVCFSAILSAFMWGYIYSKVFPAMFGIRSLLGVRNAVIPAIVAIGLWNGQGINMLIYYSGLKSIPTDLYESSIVDGAGVFRRFLHITLPLLAPSFTVCVTLSLTGWLREFAATMASTGGGPARASETMSIYIYQNLFTYNKAGYGQAVAISFAAVLVLLGQSVSAYFRKREVHM